MIDVPLREYARKWNRDESNNFAIACYEQNSMRELEKALEQEHPDTIDMRTWGISAQEWREAIEAALTVNTLEEEING